MNMDELIESLQHCITLAASGWYIVKIYATLSLRKAMSMTLVEHAISWSASGVNAQAENRRLDKKRKASQLDGQDLSASSGVRQNKAAKTKSPKPAKPTLVVSSSTERARQPECVHCGMRHNLKLSQTPGWQCAFVRGCHPHVNEDKSTAFCDSKWGKHYARFPWKDEKSGEMRTMLCYDRLCNAQGAYENHQLKKHDSKSDLFPFLVNISNIGGLHDLNPFMSSTILSSNLIDRKEAIDMRTLRKLIRAGMTTNSGIIDSGAIDSDYISTTLFDRISNTLGYKLS